MKGFWIIILGLLMHWASLEAPAVAFQNTDTYSRSTTHHSYEMVAHSESWCTVDSEQEAQKLKKVHRSDFSAFGGKGIIPALSYVAGYTSHIKKVAVPLRYSLCVLRL